MTPQTERRAVAFIRTVANRCERCLHRSDVNCRPCLSAWANAILRDIEAEEDSGAAVDYSLGARMLRIVQALSRADRPLQSSEINLDGLCTRQLKQWTLLHMIKNGMIKRIVSTAQNGRPVYLYSLNKPKTP